MEETSYPQMRRPKRKLCYLTSKEKTPKRWGTPLTLEDVDKMFDDLDSPSEKNVPSPSSPGQTFCSRPNLYETEISPIQQEGTQMVPGKNAPEPEPKSVCDKLDVDVDNPFKIHGAVKTSSPIQDVKDVKHAEKPCDENVVPQAQIHLEDESQESQSPPSEKLACNGEVTDESGISGLGTPPKEFFLQSTRKEKNPEASQRPENTECPAVALREEPALPPPDKKSETLHRKPPVESTSHAVNNMTTFLQKLKETGQPKLACSRKPVFPVKVSACEPEDDFAILEDDATFQFSIPSKNAPSKRLNQSRTSSSDKDTDKETPQRGPRNQDLEKTNGKAESQADPQKIKSKKKEKETDNDKRPEMTTDEMLSEQEKPNKKRNQLKKVQSKVKDTAKSPFKDKVGSETEPENPEQNTETTTEGLKAAKESTKKTRTKPLQRTRKRLQSSDGNKKDAEVKKQSPEGAGPEDSRAENRLAKCDSNGNAKQSKPTAEPAVTSSSSSDGEVHEKRKRKPPVQWWVIDPVGPSPEETDDRQLSVKKSKKTSKAPHVPAPSPVKDKKYQVSKKRTQKETLSSDQDAKKAKGKEMKRNKKQNKNKDSPQKEEMLKAADERRDEVHEGGRDEEESSPLVFSHQTIDLGGQIFQRVYHHSSNHKMSPHTAADPQPQPDELLRDAESAKRRRKPTGSWWMVNDNMADGAEPVAPKKQQQPAVKKPKPRKKRKPQPEQDELAGLSTGCTVGGSSQPAGGAPAPPLKLKQLFTPKTVKGSLAKFADIYATDMETPAMAGNRDAQLKNRRTVEETAASDRTTPIQTQTDAAGSDSGDEAAALSSLHTQTSPQDDRSHFFKSGPCSMIPLEEYEESEALPTSAGQADLSPADLCSPPLKPLLLQPNDKSNLAEWFRTLWSTLASNDAEVTPDQFDWFFYQDKAMGLQVDLSAAAVCNGKMMLGSHMKKPLWVDHSATTVFNLLTSSVSVTVDGSESLFHPGQSFMVNCGRAYSIRNVTSQPAMLYFTRMSAESADSSL